MITRKKVIMVDVDGVILNWLKGYNEWLITEKKLKSVPIFHDDLVRQFNSSVHIGYLDGIKDAEFGINSFINLGFRIVFCSSFSNNKYAHLARMRNLSEKLLNYRVEEHECHFLDFESPKTEIIKKYGSSLAYFVDDFYFHITGALKVNNDVECILFRTEDGSQHRNPEDDKAVENSLSTLNKEQSRRLLTGKAITNWKDVISAVIENEVVKGNRKCELFC